MINFSGKESQVVSWYFFITFLFCCDFGSILLVYWPGIMIHEMLLASTLEFVILHDFIASWKAKWKEAKQTKVPNSKVIFPRFRDGETSKLCLVAGWYPYQVVGVVFWYSSASEVTWPKIAEMHLHLGLCVLVCFASLQNSWTSAFLLYRNNSIQQACIRSTSTNTETELDL